MSVNAAEVPSEDEVREIVKKNLRSTERKNFSGIEQTVHPQSPARPSLRASLDAIGAWELKFVMRELEYIGTTGGFVLYSVVYDTIRVSGPPLVDNRTKNVWVFRQSGGYWLFWSQLVLHGEPLTQDLGRQRDDA